MKTFLWVLAVIIFVVAIIALEIWFFMALWNWLMPMLFGLKEITFKAALGIILLIDILFGGGLLSSKG